MIFIDWSFWAFWIFRHNLFTRYLSPAALIALRKCFPCKVTFGSLFQHVHKWEEPKNPQRNVILHTLYFWRRPCILAAHFTSAVLESTKSLIRACLLPRPASPPPAVLEGGQTKASSCPTSDVTCNGPAPDMAPQLRQACLDTSYGLQSEERNVYKIIIRISAQLLIQVLHIWFLPPYHVPQLPSYYADSGMERSDICCWKWISHEKCWCSRCRIIGKVNASWLMVLTDLLALAIHCSSQFEFIHIQVRVYSLQSLATTYHPNNAYPQWFMHMPIIFQRHNIDRYMHPLHISQSSEFEFIWGIWSEYMMKYIQI